MYLVVTFNFLPLSISCHFSVYPVCPASSGFLVGSLVLSSLVFYLRLLRMCLVFFCFWIIPVFMLAFYLTLAP